MWLSKSMDRLPLELLELLLLRTSVKLFTDHYKSQFNVRRVSVQRSYSALAAVCYNWWQTMNGWPQSPTGHWFRHKLQTRIKTACRPFSFHPRLQHSLTMSSDVWGVAQYDDKLFVVSHESNTILVFGPNFEPLTSIEVQDLKQPNDIVACAETGQLYVADMSYESLCVWRVSPCDGEIVQLCPAASSSQQNFWIANSVPWSLSITSRRLLVTSINELVHYEEDGTERNRISFPDIVDDGQQTAAVSQVQHAVETSRRTFVVIRLDGRPRISEIDAGGNELRVYCDQQRLSRPWYLALDSDGRVFVADNRNRCVLLLDDRLELERILEDEKQHQLVEDPSCMCYVWRTGQLIVAGGNSESKFINVYNVRYNANVSSSTCNTP